MTQRSHIQIVVFFCSVAWGVMLISRGVAVSWDLCNCFGTVVAVATAGYFGFERWGWRWKCVQHFAQMPDLNGTWRVILQSDFIRPGETEPIGPITAFMAVTQTHSTLSMRQMTQESESVLLASKVIRAEDGRYEVAAVYQNTPEQVLRDRSAMHYGAFLLKVRLDDTVTVDGEYWTGRKTRGQMRFVERRRTLYQSWASASKAFGEEQKIDG